MQRIGVLNGNNITYDHDLAGLVRGLTDGGVIQGGEISENKVQPVQAVIACQRSNGQKLMLYFESDEQVAIPSSGTFKVYIEVNQAKIDDGSENAENGTGIAEIKTGPTLPSQNFLLLASVAGGAVKDERNLIPKIQSVAQRTESLSKTTEEHSLLISQLVESGIPSYLGKTSILGEKAESGSEFFLEKQPDYQNCDIAESIGSSNENMFVHIQRIASGVKSNSIKLKIKKIGLPTVGLNIEIKRGVRVDVSENEIYWYGGDTIMSTTIPHSDISSDYQELTITFPSEMSFNRGELIVVSLSQVGATVNALNYYQIACSNSGYSESSSCVFINSSGEKVRKKTIPYCISDSFVNEMFAKNSENLIEINNSIVYYKNAGPLRQSSDTIEFISKYTGVVNVSFSRRIDHLSAYSSYGGLQVISNGEEVFRKEHTSGRQFEPSGGTQTGTFNVNAGDIIKIKVLGGWNGKCEVSNIDMTMNTVKLSKKGFVFRSNKIPNVGEKMNCFFYGFVNGELMNPVLLSETVDSVKTGTITLGNAVGFVKIHIGGKDFALPLYGV